MKKFLLRIDWTHMIRIVIWWAVLVYGVSAFLKATVVPVLGFWVSLGLIYLPIVLITFRWIEKNEQNKEPHTGRFWWLWWDHEDVRAWRGMTDAEKAICSAYRVPPALVGTRHAQGRENGSQHA